MKTLLLCCLLCFGVRAARADEGMWPYNQVPVEAIRSTFGVSLDSTWLRHLQRSTVRLGNGCSGSLVSPDGLVLTNHHCVQDVLVGHSTEQNDLFAHGFVARSRAEELPAPTIAIDVLVEMQDVTARVRAALAGLDDQKANEARKRVLSQIELASEAASRKDPATGSLHCEVVTLYQGGQYMLYRYKRYEDVRLVFAPEDAIADYGGDPDNFQYPRWDLDMALVRVYEDGKPAHTPEYLHASPAGPAESDPVFVSGQPGTTERLLTVAQLERERDAVLPLRALLESELRGRYLQFGKIGPEENREVQDPLLDLENGLKVRRMELAALLDDSLLASKARDERALRAAVTADPALARDAGGAWDEVAHAQARARELEVRHDLTEGRSGMRGTLWTYARTIVRGAAEREKPNGERLREFVETQLPYVEQRLLAPDPVYPAIERLEMSFGFERLREWLGPDDPLVHAVLGRTAPDTLAARLVAGTRLADPAFREQLWKGGAKAVAASDDPMIVYVRTLDPALRAIRKQWEDEVDAPTTRGSEAIARARFAVYGTSRYPDATSTLRFNAGRVEGWTEAGKPVAPFTTIGQAFARATGDDPLALPPSWIGARAALDPATLFNYCTTNDIVGGNSGSPVVNAKGELVGLVFDGNIESIAGTYWFDPRVNRTVAVHPAAMREALVRIYGAEGLAREMGLVR